MVAAESIDCCAMICVHSGRYYTISCYATNVAQIKNDVVQNN